MKKLLLIWLFSCSLDGFSQILNAIANRDGKMEVLKPDTVRAKLHVSSNKSHRMCYILDGYVVLMADDIAANPVYLDDKRLPIPPNIIVWQYIKCEEPKKRRAKQ
jgi:hypothetical protein